MATMLVVSLSVASSFVVCGGVLTSRSEFRGRAYEAYL